MAKLSIESFNCSASDPEAARYFSETLATVTTSCKSGNC